MKKKYLLILTLFVSLFVLVGCGGKDNALVGKWQGYSDDGKEYGEQEAIFEFKSDDTVSFVSGYGIEGNGTYEIKEDIVSIKLDSWEKAKDYKFEVKDNKLSLKAQDEYSPSYSEMVKQ